MFVAYNTPICNSFMTYCIQIHEVTFASRRFDNLFSEIEVGSIFSFYSCEAVSKHAFQRIRIRWKEEHLEAMDRMKNLKNYTVHLHLA